MPRVEGGEVWSLASGDTDRRNHTNAVGGALRQQIRQEARAGKRQWRMLLLGKRTDRSLEAMPKFTEAQIKSGLKDGSISAISIDTAIFDTFGCKLDAAALARLDQFKKGGVRLLFSEIVVKEITAHIVRDASERARELRRALKYHHRRWKSEKELGKLQEILGLDRRASELAQAQVDEFLNNIGADTVPASGNGDLSSEVIRRYFEEIAPFEAVESKKSEFPDAFALLSLEQRAAERGSRILCVSPDKGWAAFAENSDHLIVVPKLDEVLSWFNDPGKHLAEKVLAMWKAGALPHLVHSIEREFEFFLDGFFFDVEGDAPLDYEAEPVSAVLQSIDAESIANAIVIAEDDEGITFTVTVSAKVGFEANFNFYAHDSIDGDNISLGSQTPYTEEDLAFEIDISVARTLDPSDFEDAEVSIRSRPIAVDFGYVDPFPHDDPTFEKY